MDADESGLARSAAGEAVRSVGRSGDDVTWTAVEGLFADRHQDVAIQDHEGLVVGVVMQAGSLAGPVVPDDGPCLPPSKVREMSLPGRLLAFTWYMDHVSFDERTSAGTGISGVPGGSSSRVMVSVSHRRYFWAGHRRRWASLKYWSGDMSSHITSAASSSLRPGRSGPLLARTSIQSRAVGQRYGHLFSNVKGERADVKHRLYGENFVVDDKIWTAQVVGEFHGHTRKRPPH